MNSSWMTALQLAALALFSIDVLVLYGLASWDYRES